MRLKINFASREYLQARKVYLALMLLLAASVLVFAYNYRVYKLASSEGAALKSQIELQRRLTDAMAVKLAQARKKVDRREVEATAMQAQFANMAIMKKAFSWTLFLNRLEDVVPDGVGIISIQPNFQTMDVDISGTALGMGQLTEFLTRLTRSPYYEDIPPTFHTSEIVVDKDIGMTAQVFNLKIRYNPEGRTTPSAASGKKAKP
jgi:Tfp pilus assembly protein PilN